MNCLEHSIWISLTWALNLVQTFEWNCPRGMNWKLSKNLSKLPLWPQPRCVCNKCSDDNPSNDSEGNVENWLMEKLSWVLKIFIMLLVISMKVNLVLQIINHCCMPISVDLHDKKYITTKRGKCSKLLSKFTIRQNQCLEF